MVFFRGEEGRSSVMFLVCCKRRKKARKVVCRGEGLCVRGRVFLFLRRGVR